MTNSSRRPSVGGSCRFPDVATTLLKSFAKSAKVFGRAFFKGDRAKRLQGLEAALELFLV
jgi:hypothetical protein